VDAIVFGAEFNLRDVILEERCFAESAKNSVIAV
jgi:hypothetical protein